MADPVSRGGMTTKLKQVVAKIGTAVLLLSSSYSYGTIGVFPILAQFDAVMEKEVQSDTDTLPAPERSLDGHLGPILDDLQWCESRDNPRAINPADPVTASMGLFQFKFETFKYYTRMYDLLPQVEDEELWNWIYDGEYQRELTRTILENEPSAIRNWHNCAKAYNLYARLGV